MPGASSYNVYVTQTASSMGELLATVSALTYVDTGSATPSPSGIEPSVNTTSGVASVDAQALDAGSAGNVSAPEAIVSLDTVLTHVISVTNLEPMSGGAEEESDERLPDPDPRGVHGHLRWRQRHRLQAVGGIAGRRPDHGRARLERCGHGAGDRDEPGRLTGREHGRHRTAGLPRSGARAPARGRHRSVPP